MSMDLQKNTISTLVRLQKTETERVSIYTAVIPFIKNPDHAETLQKLTEDAAHHAKLWERITGTHHRVPALLESAVRFTARMLGSTFTLRLFSCGRSRMARAYDAVSKEVPEALFASFDERRGNEQIQPLLESSRLITLSSIIQKTGDAGSVFAGILAGLTYTMQNNRLTASAGIVAATATVLSVTGSAYISNTDISVMTEKDYNGATFATAATAAISFAMTCILMLPYLLFSPGSCHQAVITMGISALLLTAAASFFTSVVKGRRFLFTMTERTLITAVTAGAAMLAGLAARTVLDIDI